MLMGEGLYYTACDVVQYGKKAEATSSWVPSSPPVCEPYSFQDPLSLFPLKGETSADLRLRLLRNEGLDVTPAAPQRRPEPESVPGDTDKGQAKTPGYVEQMVQLFEDLEAPDGGARNADVQAVVEAEAVVQENSIEGIGFANARFGDVPMLHGPLRKPESVTGGGFRSMRKMWARKRRARKERKAQDASRKAWQIRCSNHQVRIRQGFYRIAVRV